MLLQKKTCHANCISCWQLRYLYPYSVLFATHVPYEKGLFLLQRCINSPNVIHIAIQLRLCRHLHFSVTIIVHPRCTSNNVTLVFITTPSKHVHTVYTFHHPWSITNVVPPRSVHSPRKCPLHVNTPVPTSYIKLHYIIPMYRNTIKAFSPRILCPVSPERRSCINTSESPTLHTFSPPRNLLYSDEHFLSLEYAKVTISITFFHHGPAIRFYLQTCRWYKCTFFKRNLQSSSPLSVTTSEVGSRKSDFHFILSIGHHAYLPVYSTFLSHFHKYRSNHKRCTRSTKGHHYDYDWLQYHTSPYVIVQPLYRTSTPMLY